MVNDGITEQWHTLVSDAQSASGIHLNSSLENYLVNTLIHYTQRTDIAERVFAIDYMLAQHEQGHTRRNQLRELADQCLLYAGLFPQYAKQHNVNSKYFIDLGRSAYFDLATIKDSITSIFEELCQSFIKLMQTLLAIPKLKTYHTHNMILQPVLTLPTETKNSPSNILDLTSKLLIKPPKK